MASRSERGGEGGDGRKRSNHRHSRHSKSVTVTVESSDSDGSQSDSNERPVIPGASAATPAKSPGHLKAFHVFKRDEFARMKGDATLDYPGKTALISATWKAMTPEQKQPYVDRAKDANNDNGAKETGGAKGSGRKK